VNIRPNVSVNECHVTQNVTKFVQISDDEGAYIHIYRDVPMPIPVNIEEMSRTGKVTGNTQVSARGHKRHFGVRGVKYDKSSHLKQPSLSNFQVKYPNKQVNFDDPLVMKRGYFEDLTMYVLVGFDRSNTQALDLLCDPKKEIFVWTPTFLKVATRLSLTT